MTTSNATDATAAMRLPSVGCAMPTFTLDDTAGVSRRLWDYKQRRPVLLTLLRDTRDPLGREWLARLAACRSALDEYRAAVLIAAPEPMARLRDLQAALDLPFILLADPTGDVVSHYLPPVEYGGRLAIYLADRYLQCLGRWLIREEPDLPAIGELAAALKLADQDDCACGLPAWPEG